MVWEGTNVLAVPSSAVFRHGDGWAVFAIVDGSARVQPIEIGHRGRHDIEVMAGLAEGCHVVLYPGDRVREGVQVVARP